MSDGRKTSLKEWAQFVDAMKLVTPNVSTLICSTLYHQAVKISFNIDYFEIDEFNTI